MEAIHEYRLVIPAEAMDANRHANNVEYVRWMQEAAISHADACGGSAATREAGASWVVRSHHVEYLRPVFADETLMIQTWVSTLRKSSSLRKYRFFRGEELMARGETLWVFVEAATGRPRPIAPAVTAAFVLVPPDKEPQGCS